MVAEPARIRSRTSVFARGFTVAHGATPITPSVKEYQKETGGASAASADGETPSIVASSPNMGAVFYIYMVRICTVAVGAQYSNGRSAAPAK